MKKADEITVFMLMIIYMDESSLILAMINKSTVFSLCTEERMLNSPQ